ncbi:hypothetical protein DFR52_106127 [Hoeflea marina]|uniref:Lipoprotein n=1 Tax=Hoeflea marina TaxID=274592 RepID=A0A317PFM7_9HYPH|nr:hypothetical protein [Hoeflea marina]PWV97604.1 hypothetical protein DFR52_106127 [Hoeflea marina]
MDMTPARMALLTGLVVLLAACNSTEQTLAPIPGDGSDSSSAATVAPVTPVATDAAFAAAAPSGRSGPAAGNVVGSIRFTPVIGAPLSAVTPLSRQLGLSARTLGYTIKSANDQDGDHILKGYFSAISDDTKTTVVYVWDILDPSGNRLHRIQGQEEIPGAPPAGADAWSTVPPALMEKIAARTLADYNSWRQTASG